MSDDPSIRKAEFDPKVCTYWLLSGALVLTLTVIGIPLLLIWFPLGQLFTRRYLDRMACELTPKALKVKKGILVRIEKTIPLEKITDMGMVQGPIMRHFGLHKLTVETAGQSGPGALVSLTGIIDAKAFREAVLAQRDALGTVSPEAGGGTGRPPAQGDAAVLVEVRDALLRIEALLEQRPGDH